MLKMSNKELFADHHENLMNRFMDLYPDASWDEAYDSTMDEAYETFDDYVADLSEYLQEY